MHLPSRGLRLSATTMRNAGVFFAPMRFMRILTDIRSFVSRGGGQPQLFCHPPELRRVSKKRGEPRHRPPCWQAPFPQKGDVAKGRARTLPWCRLSDLRALVPKKLAKTGKTFT